MPPRNHRHWSAVPKLEHISSESYNNYSIYEQEIEHIFSKVWIPMCHFSEMANDGDFRSSQIAHQNVVAVNCNGEVKVYLCPSIDRPAGNGIDISGLTELHSGIKHGGMIWTTLDPNPSQSIEEICSF